MQKDANLVELEKCCRTHIFLQNFGLIPIHILERAAVWVAQIPDFQFSIFNFQFSIYKSKFVNFQKFTIFYEDRPKKLPENCPDF